MGKRFQRALILGAVVGATASLTLASVVYATDVKGKNGNATIKRTGLTGAAEVGGGDKDGGGSAKLWLYEHKAKVCYTIKVRWIKPVMAAHIHSAPAGVNGSIVVDFMISDATMTVAPGRMGKTTYTQCVHASNSTIDLIKKNPSAYYVNVHNADFPGGALRGQLH